jgi:riboflavin kinase/FMN adenylyltransferase
MQFPIQITGTVKPNKGRGRTLGYPTANLDFIPDIEEGIYVSKTHYNNLELPSLMFIGAAVTFGDTEKMCEVYILDYNKELYGKKIEVTILQKLRDNIKFNSSEELVKQMNEDERMAREFFKKS